MARVLCSENRICAAVSSKAEEVLKWVTGEFGEKAELFTPVIVRMDSRTGEEFEATKKPGVYVYLNEDGMCLKVGKHHLNASKRALEHCRDNTRSKDGTIQMEHLIESHQTYLLIFALQKSDALHWVLALEHFLEKQLNPKIRSRRNG